MHDQHDSDEEYLASLGYGQQLFREMGGFSNFAISFSIISILTGAVLLYGYGLKFAGPLANSVGWPLVSIFTLAVAASMAEIASAYPTAGGLYFWSSRLGGHGWGWTTAWLNMIGQVTITAGVNIAAAIYLIGATTHLLGMPADTGTNWYFQVAIMVVITIPQVLINVYGIRVTALLSDISVWWHIAGGAVIVLALAFAGRHHNTLAFLFSFRPTGAAEVAKWYGVAPAALLFVLSLLQAQWTYTGYDASAHVAEETKMARLNSAWGIFLSVAVSAVVGYVMLMVLTWCIPNGDVAATVADPYPVLYIVAKNLTPLLTNVIAILIGGAMWLCGLASVTSMGRMWYAFARDDGMPGSSLLKRVSGKHRTPAWAIVITSILSVLVCLYAAAFNVVTSISTIALYLAYVIPIFLNFRNRLTGRGQWMTRAVAPWSLGRFAPVINAIAIVWVALITVIFMLPPNQLVFWTMLGLSAFMIVWWFISERRGPRRTAQSAPTGRL
jgi:amino acid transporter